MKPNVLVLKTDGTNCDEETKHAFDIAHANAEIIHINQLRTNKKLLNNFQILAIPGGFSYGDDIVSGKILAIELISFFQEQIQQFIDRKNTLVIGICNGFQVLVRTGLLPFRTLGNMQATLTNNDSGHFECRWINLKVDKNTNCVFLKNLVTSDGGRLSVSKTMTPPRWINNDIISYQVAHGEGKFYANEETIKEIEKQNLVALRYVDEKGNSTQKYPNNPNGSINAIAGVTDPTGRILGLMPHPERFVKKEHHPNWRRMEKNLQPQGFPLFRNMVNFVKS